MKDIIRCVSGKALGAVGGAPFLSPPNDSIRLENGKIVIQKITPAVRRLARAARAIRLARAKKEAAA
jgi:hypothetical protein